MTRHTTAEQTVSSFHQHNIPALNKLLARYADHRHPAAHDCAACHQDQDACPQAIITEGQAHRVATIFNSCADSRFHAGVTFHPEMGEIFGIQSIGATIPKGDNPIYATQWGGIEYAVEHLHAHHFVELGHTRCGAIAGAVDVFNGAQIASKNLRLSLESMVPLVEEARRLFTDKYRREPNRAELRRATEFHNVRVSTRNVAAYMQTALGTTPYSAHGWVIDAATGIIHALQPDDSFKPITFNPVRVDQNDLPKDCATGVAERGQRLVIPIHHHAEHYI